MRTTAIRLLLAVTLTAMGGILAVADEMTMEFDYPPLQGHCRAADGKFAAKGIGIYDDQAEVSINYGIIVAPDTGRVIGPAFLLEVRKDGYLPWVVHVGTGLTGSVEDISQDISPGGDVVLTVKGTVSGFHRNEAPTSIRKPFRLEATCDLRTGRSQGDSRDLQSHTKRLATSWSGQYPAYT